MAENTIEHISIAQLCKMQGEEGLILQGCGGDPQEWLDGINDLLAKSNILTGDNKFRHIYIFEHESLTNILFPFDGIELDTGRLALWRLQTHEQFSGTWLSDYLPNKLGMELGSSSQEQAKPDCPLIGADGNIFNLMGIASRTLRHSGMVEQATEMCSRVRESGDYYSALNIIGEYVNITSAEETERDVPQMGGMTLG